jgi:hypothetical protein
MFTIYYLIMFIVMVYVSSSKRQNTEKTLFTIYIRIISANQIAPIGEGFQCYAEIGLRRGGGTESCSVSSVGPFTDQLGPCGTSSISMPKPSLNGLRTINETFTT